MTIALTLFAFGFVFVFGQTITAAVPVDATKPLPATATFSFHQDKLGETLERWKANTKYPYVSHCYKNNDHSKDGTATCTRELLHQPFSDSGTASSPSPRDNEKELAGVNAAYTERLTVVGQLVHGEVNYQFYKGQLYKIEFQVLRNISSVTEAYQVAYGPPTETKKITYKNRYGATVDGQDIRWIDTGRHFALNLGIVNDVVPRVDVTFLDTAANDARKASTPKKNR